MCSTGSFQTGIFSYRPFKACFPQDFSAAVTASLGSVSSHNAVAAINWKGVRLALCIGRHQITYERLIFKILCACESSKKPWLLQSNPISEARGYAYGEFKYYHCDRIFYRYTRQLSPSFQKLILVYLSFILSVSVKNPRIFRMAPVSQA
ncbi:hypothetical protein ANANG_G00093930 [Anguilla anguilla]|uniref:Uncharacterized protein n=1 Tax=Anguilla anguilla TaxID=7936 RepID=A0A9D3MQI5_ANGAN|nr:hypothetical protein ANANG_G00093930 [Anguilla anguilla]